MLTDLESQSIQFFKADISAACLSRALSHAIIDPQCVILDPSRDALLHTGR